MQPLQTQAVLLAMIQKNRANGAAAITVTSSLFMTNTSETRDTTVTVVTATGKYP